MSLDHFWSLAVEEQFYLIWPMAVFILRDLKRLLLTCVALSFAALLLRFVLATHNVAYHTINRNTLCRMDALLIGAALALLLRSEFQDVVSRSAKKLFFAVVAVVGALNVTGFAGTPLSGLETRFRCGLPLCSLHLDGFGICRVSRVVSPALVADA